MQESSPLGQTGQSSPNGQPVQPQQAVQAHVSSQSQTTPATPVQPVQQQPVQANPPLQPIQQQAFQQTAPTSGTVSQPPTTNGEKFWSAVSYIPFVAFIALILKPESLYVRLHGRQGLLLSIILIAALFLSFFLYMFLPAGFVFFLWSVFQLGLIAVGGFSLYQAALGNWWKIPVLGDFAEKIPAELFAKIATGVLTGQPPAENDEIQNSK